MRFSSFSNWSYSKFKIIKDAGLEISERGGVVVDEYMQTSDPDIYALGDCVEIPNLITKIKFTHHLEIWQTCKDVVGENLIKEMLQNLKEQFKQVFVKF